MVYGWCMGGVFTALVVDLLPGPFCWLHLLVPFVGLPICNHDVGDDTPQVKGDVVTCRYCCDFVTICESLIGYNKAMARLLLPMWRLLAGGHGIGRRRYGLRPGWGPVIVFRPESSLARPLATRLLTCCWSLLILLFCAVPADLWPCSLLVWLTTIS